MAVGTPIIKLVQQATRKLASSGNFDDLLKEVLSICVEAGNALGGTIYIHDPEAKRLKFQHVLPAEVVDRLPVKDMPDDYGMAGQAFQSRQTMMRDFPIKPESEWNEFEKYTGVQLRTMIAVPLMMADEDPIGVVQLINKREGCFDETDQIVLDIVSAVCTMGYLNARLTEESTRASTLLGMGKVSHDIGNLAASLYATLSYVDMPLDGLRDLSRGQGDSTFYLDTIHEIHSDLRRSVDRIVGYARLISDLSAGRTLRPNFEMRDMADIIETAAAYLETEGRKNHVEIIYDLDKSAPQNSVDDLFVFRIVQNLVGNSIKAVRETFTDTQMSEAAEDETLGKVIVRYRYENNEHHLEVEDSGPGMTPEIAEKILSGNARSMWEKGGGSGWGTKIVKELAASHDAKLAIRSKIGHGSTFCVVFPVRAAS